MLKSNQQTGEALFSAWAARSGSRMFHPHHVLFIPSVHILLRCLSPFLGSGDALAAAQIHNGFWVIVAVVCVFCTVRRLVESDIWGAVAAVAFFLSQGVWFYTTIVEAYVPATAFLALIVLLLVQRDGIRSTYRETIALSLLLSGAILYHQGNVLFCFALGYFLVAARGREGVRTGLIVGAISALVVLVVYLLGFLSTGAERTPRALMSFFLTDASFPIPNWGTPRNLSLSGLAALLSSQRWCVLAVPKPAESFATFLFAAALAALVGWSLLGVVRKRPQASLRGALLVWLAVHYLFYLWWLPTERHFFVTSVLPLLLLLCLALKDGVDAIRERGGSARVLPIAGISAAVCLFAMNVYGTVVPLHFTEDPEAREAREVAQQLPPGCVVIGRYRFVQLLRYFHGRERVVPGGLPVLFILAEKKMPEVLAVGDEECACVTMAYLTPEYAVGAFGGYQLPSRWLRYVEWVFKIEYDAAHRAVSCKDFEVVPGDSGTPYVCTRQERMPLAGLETLFETLDRRLAVIPGERPPFEEWFVKAGREAAQPTAR